MARRPSSALRRLTAPAFLAAAMLIGLDPASAQPVQVGIAAGIVGDVGISNAAMPAERKIARKQRVAWGDTIRTRKKSLLQILLLDRSNFSIGANTRMLIDRFVYDPTKGRSLVARVLTGAFRFMSGRKHSNSTARIDSPVGTIGIRGTALDGLVGKDAMNIAENEPSIGRNVGSDQATATLVVLRGPGERTEGALAVGIAEVTAAGKTVVLDRPELAAYIPRPGAQPIGPFALSSGGLSKVQDLLDPAVIQATKGNTLRNILVGAVAATAAAAILSDDDDDHDDRRRYPPREPSGSRTPQQSDHDEPSVR